MTIYIVDLFRAAAEAGPSDILKLYNEKGSIVNISPKLMGNTPDSRYRLEVVASQKAGNTVLFLYRLYVRIHMFVIF